MRAACWVVIPFLSVLGLVLCSSEEEGESWNKDLPVFEALQEWHQWKVAHSKSYRSTQEELERHIVWHSNRVFVEQHNRNAEEGIYSYQVKLNHLGDLVRLLLVRCHTSLQD